MKEISVGILGATSYTGSLLARLLGRHSNVAITFVSSQTYAGQKFSAVFGELTGICDQVLLSPEQAQAKTSGFDCLFSCLPHGVAADLLLPFIDKGVRVIDLSADFRLRDAAVYKQWYEHEHPRPDLLAKAVFGLPEHYRKEIAKCSILANPGCYPTSILLPVMPLLKDHGTHVASIIADSKSGVSGAGRSLKLSSLFCEADENLTAYSVGHAHRHVSEIDQELSAAAGKKMRITFSPHLVPLNRGILSTMYLDTNRTAAQCSEIAAMAYAQEPFVRMRDEKDLPKVSYVAGTNYCDIAFTGGKDGMPVIAVCVIDNLMKGASGQAVQNFNIMFGFDEREGIQ